MREIDVTVKLEVQTCCVCGIPFAAPDYYWRDKRNTGKSFCCPNGHAQSYTDSLAKQLKEAKQKIEAERQRVALYQGWYKTEQDDHAGTRRRLSATKGVLTKTKKRISAGVCPCCSRHFENLAQHMAGQHPDYATEETPTND